MSRISPHDSTARHQIKRQISLPLSRAVEIAYKSIRLRLSRSLVVTSGIILALAFLMSILTNEAMIDGMRRWAGGWTENPEYHAIVEQREQAQAQLQPLTDRLHQATVSMADAEGVAAFDPEKSLGASWKDLQRQARQLPGAPEDLGRAMVMNPELVPVMQQWLALTRETETLRERQNGGQWLQKMMKDNGIATTAEDIESNRIQTRWMLGLALLVAFVGILNAMLMSVTERFREIGTMKCLGALDGFIVKLFLIESLFQGVVGTVVGILVGLGLSVAALSSTYGAYAWKNPPGGQILLAVAFCLAVGIGLTVGGAVYPAWQAARMQPIDAMRVEA